MQQTFLSILGIYFFVALGFIAKATLKEKIDQKTLVYYSVYFLQPILIFWGITKRPIDLGLIYSPLIFLLVVLATTVLTHSVAKRILTDPKDISIFTFAGLAGNTGNLAIPVGETVLGPESIPYLTMINIANSFFFYILGVYFYSRGTYSIKDSIKNVVKIPLLWIAAFSIIIRALNFEPTGLFEELLTKGAYASIVIQLAIFGMYLYGNKVQKNRISFTFSILFQKFILLPAIGLVAIIFANLNPLISKSLFLQFMVPLAINNISFASLFNCKPKTVTQITLVSSILALAILPLGFIVIEYFI